MKRQRKENYVPVLLILLDVRLGHLATNKTLGVETVFCGLEWNACLALSPTRRSSSVKPTHDGVAVTLVVGDDFDATAAVETDARICCPEIDTDYRAVLFVFGRDG